ncbi:MAG: glycosyltransferase [Gammaproteobacteria bacterium]|nr:glycosyltransferase [Gammaproteobacteria bacterium]
MNPCGRFLYLGRLAAGARDVPTLIRAFDRLVAADPTIELAVVGGGDLFDETQALIHACAARGSICCRVSTSRRWLIWADCRPAFRMEGLSNALLEAMAHGLACIANDIPPESRGACRRRCGRTRTCR